MPKYRVHAQAMTGYTIDVEMDIEITEENKEEAIAQIEDAAFSEGIGGLCHQCSGGSKWQNWTREEGEPEPVLGKDGLAQVELLED